MSKPLAYETVAERFMNFKCELLTTKEEYEGGKMKIRDTVLLKMSCGHERRTWYARLANEPDLLCESCMLLLTQNKVYGELQDFYKERNCTLLTTMDEFIAKGMKISVPFLYIASCGHENTCVTCSFKKNPKGLCKKCMRKELDDAKRYSYDFVAERFKNYQCEMLTTRDEYEQGGLKAESTFRVRMPCGHERDTNFKMVKDIPDMVCKDCTRQRSQSGLYAILVERFAEYKCKLLTSLDTYVENNMNTGDAFDYECTCGHTRNGYLYFLAENTTCKDCTFNKFRHEKRLEYDVLKGNFEKDGCKLLTTEEEYNQRSMTYRDECLLVMTCGHERMCAWKNFQLSTITLCQECVLQKVSRNNQLLENCKIDGNARGNVIEYEAFKYIRNLVKDVLDVKKLREGTKADFLIRPKGVADDIWLPIQLKAAVKQRERGEYVFTFRRDYSEMVILCVCVVDERIWMFDGEISQNITGIAINDSSKYDYGRVVVEDLSDRFMMFYKQGKIPNVLFRNANIPISPGQQIEYEYQILRENNLADYINFTYPELEGQVFDFFVNDKCKVQEKVAVIVKNTNMETARVCFDKHGGIGKKKHYKQGDNDFYWVACQDKDTFYIFPECILVEKGFLTTSSISAIVKTINLHYTVQTKEELLSLNTRFVDDWTMSYRYKYSNLDIPKLRALFA